MEKLTYDMFSKKWNESHPNGSIFALLRDWKTYDEAKPSYLYLLTVVLNDFYPQDISDMLQTAWSLTAGTVPARLTSSISGTRGVKIGAYSTYNYAKAAADEITKFSYDTAWINKHIYEINISVSDINNIELVDPWGMDTVATATVIPDSARTFHLDWHTTKTVIDGSNNGTKKLYGMAWLVGKVIYYKSGTRFSEAGLYIDKNSAVKAANNLKDEEEKQSGEPSSVGILRLALDEPFKRSTLHGGVDKQLLKQVVIIE